MTRSRIPGGYHMDLSFTRLLLPLLVVLCVASVSRAAASDDTALATFFGDFLDRDLKNRPLEATRLGDHRYDNKLEDLSAGARAKWTVNYRDTLADLPKKVKYDALSRNRKIDYEIFEHHLKRTLWLTEN